MKSATPANVLSYIQEAYHRYYDSAFWMRDEYIMRERRALLDEAGLTVTAQEMQEPRTGAPLATIESYRGRLRS